MLLQHQMAREDVDGFSNLLHLPIDHCLITTLCDHILLQQYLQIYSGRRRIAHTHTPVEARAAGYYLRVPARTTSKQPRRRPTDEDAGCRLTRVWGVEPRAELCTR
jgi:hypothetical protein